MSVGSKPIVVFNCTKNEAFSPSKRFKSWARALSRTFEVRENNDKCVLRVLLFLNCFAVVRRVGVDGAGQRVERGGAARRQPSCVWFAQGEVQ
jgi:hypothetical protein